MGSSRNLKLRARVALVAGLLMCGFFFYFDLTQPLGVAAGISYVLVVALALIAQSKALVLLFGMLGAALTLAGFFISHPATTVSMEIVILNRSLSIVALLVITCTGFVLIHRQERFDQRLIELASIDALTGLLNRRVLLEQMNRRMEEARRYGSTLSVMMLDIDRFKGINDRFGHLAGDRVLQQVAAVIERCARRTDYYGRYGGEEFALVCPNADADEAAILAKRIREAVEALGESDLEIPCGITVSIGVAEMTKRETDLEQLLGAADRGLYRAKEAGRNRIVIEHGADPASLPRVS